MSTEENKALSRRVAEEIFNGGNLDLAYELYAPDYVLHDPSLPEDLHGPDGLKQYVAMASEAFPDARVTIVDQVAEGDKVVDQVEQAAPIRPLVEPHLGVASFDDPNRASYEVEAVRTIIPLAVSSVDFHGDRLVHAFSPRPEGPAGTEGRQPRPNPAVTETLTP